MRRDTWSNTQRSWLQTGFPLTIGLMVLQFLGLVIVTSKPEMYLNLAFLAPLSLARPWTFFTYPFVDEGFLTRSSFFSLLFLVGLTYWFCGSLERSWGTRTFAIFYWVVTLFSAVCLCIGSLVLRQPMEALALVPLAAVCVAWGLLNAEEQVSIWFIPMRGIFFPILGIGVLVFNYAQDNHWISVPFALGGCALSYFWVTNRRWSPNAAYSSTSFGSVAQQQPKLRLVGTAQAKPKDDRFSIRDLNPFEWFARRRRKKQFEKLMGDD